MTTLAIHPECQVARGALLEIGRPDLADLINDLRCVSYQSSVIAAKAGMGPEPLPDDVKADVRAIHQALALGHQVHDRTAHLHRWGGLCCPLCYRAAACDIHGDS